MNKGIIRHINPRDMILDKLKEAYSKETKENLLERLMSHLEDLSDYKLCTLYSAKYQTNPKYIVEQFEFNF